eukprot:NODE_6997_length_820_cov_158.601148_g6396_i0.p1 GENE.NODE_6997_length_820_cov_158.601148_g6396_i0~~NODE_6997_length_820_cov_158.601148_g6396_i0.p1  ORF type:complete len:205 (-),score=34.59 NODE_6997_length_820_cov_158.601148_g6396_i0:147-761(-)
MIRTIAAQCSRRIARQYSTARIEVQTPLKREDLPDFQVGRPSIMVKPVGTKPVEETPGKKPDDYIIQIGRWDPSTNDYKLDTYVYKKGPFMVLDILIAIKAHQDPTLTFRNSCCEGVCGSCAMNINGSNTLACITPVEEETVVFPLPQMPIIRDLVVDMRWFFKQVELVQNSVPKPNKQLFHIDEMKKRYLEIMKDINEKKKIA